MAKQEYYQLGELPQWENMLLPKSGESNKMLSELFIEGKELPRLKFEYPDEIRSSENINAGTQVELIMPNAND